MLDAQVLAETISDAVRDKVFEDRIQNIIVNTIVSYITDNLKASGTYVGVLPVGSPDPLSGVYTFSIATIPLLEADLVTTALLGTPAWFTMIMTKLALTVFKPQDDSGILTVGAPLLLLSASLPLPVNIANKTYFEDCWLEIATRIVSNLTTKPPLPVPFPSVAMGTGNTIFSAWV